MKAVILASGQGSRMGYRSKPLLKVAGRRIIDRTIILLKPHVDEFVFVVRSDNREIEDYLEKNWKGKVRYKIVKNPVPERGNGYSFLLASKAVGKECFILTMGDHVYSKEFVEKAVKMRGLIGDFRPKYIDVDEATKVRVKDGRVFDIGKKLKDFDCVDTGFFVLNYRAFEAAERVAERRKVVELSDVIRELKPEVSEVSGDFWMDIDTPEELKRAKKLLIRLSVKERGDGFISRHLNRKISTKISELLVDYLSPNQATLLAFFVGIVSSILVFYNLAVAGIVYQLSSVLDGIDGEIARASLRTSKFGEWMDSILDRYVDFSFLLAVAVQYFSFYQKYGFGEKGMVALVMFALIGCVMVSYTTEKFKASYRKSAYECINVLNYIPGKRDERIFVEMLLCLLNLPVLLLVVIAVVGNARVVATIVTVRMWDVQ